MGDPPYPKCLRLVRSYFFRSGNSVNILIMVGTNTVCVTRSPWTASQNVCGLNFGTVTWQVPKAGAANMNGKSAM